MLGAWRVLICGLHDSLVQFYGAYHKEGAITIALEYMDGGALSDVLQAVRLCHRWWWVVRCSSRLPTCQVGCIPEPVLANMTFQILWGLGYLKHEKRLHRVRQQRDRGSPISVRP